MQTIRSLLDKIPHWLFVGIALVAGAFVQNLKDQPDFLSALFTWDTAHLGADLKMAGAFALTAFIAWLRTDPWTAAEKRIAQKRSATTIPPIAGSTFVILFLFGGVTSSLAIVAVGSSALLSEGCTPAQQAELGQIESIVLADVQAGKTLEQIMADVGKVVGGKAGVDVAVITYDILVTLIDLGVIPSNVLPQAQAHKAALAAMPSVSTVLAARAVK